MNNKIDKSLENFQGTQSVLIEVSTNFVDVNKRLRNMDSSVEFRTYMSDGIWYCFFCSTLSFEQVEEIAEFCSVVEIRRNDLKTHFLS